MKQTLFDYLLIVYGIYHNFLVMTYSGETLYSGTKPFYELGDNELSRSVVSTYKLPFTDKVGIVLEECI